MPEEIIADQAADQQVQSEQQTEALTMEKVQELIKAEREAANLEKDKLSRDWQSRFDQLLKEKKAEQSSKLTVEERLAQIEADRQRERIEWARKEARARAGIDTELEDAFTLYLSGDPEEISTGADKLKSVLVAKEKEYLDKIAELEKKLQFGSKAPAGGNTAMKTMPIDEFNRLPGKEQAAFIDAGGIPE